MKQPLRLAIVAMVTVAWACGPSDLASLAREPTLGHVAFYLLLAPILYLARAMLEALVGEALGMLLDRVLPRWMRTRRAIWTGVALLTLLTIGAVAYWNHAGQ